MMAKRKKEEAPMKANTEKPVGLSPLSTEQAMSAAFAIPDPESVVKNAKNDWRTPKGGSSQGKKKASPRKG